MKILVLNAGSSTFKSALYQSEKDEKDILPTPLWEGLLDYGKDAAGMTARITTQDGTTQELRMDHHDLAAGVRTLVESAWKGCTQVIDNQKEITFVGHRVVHGGEKYQNPVKITQDVKNSIRELFPIAPLHNPANLKGIEILESLFPDAVHIAVFDTAFHSKIPEAAACYAIPYGWREKGVKRYGFHGISHEYCAKRTGTLLKKDYTQLKMITCHLGNGSSLAAISEGRSIDTTMGFTPMEGLVMGTRCGSLDPGILLYFLRENLMDAAQLDQCLNFASGFKGLCGSADMRDVMNKKKLGDSNANLAFDIFIHSLASHIGSMLASLGGMEALVFTGGIGENVPEVREKACAPFHYAGLAIDPNKNHPSSEDIEISTADSKVRILVIKTREELAIAQACAKL